MKEFIYVGLDTTNIVVSFRNNLKKELVQPMLTELKTKIDSLPLVDVSLIQRRKNSLVIWQKSNKVTQNLIDNMLLLKSLNNE